MTDKSIYIKTSQTLGHPAHQVFSPTKSLHELFAPETAFSTPIDIDNNKSVMQAVKDLKTKPSLATLKQTLSGNESVEELLFDARANVKIMASAVSMHIKPELRKKLFRQIDMLHDPDDWEPEDIPINKSSFKMFLSGFLQISPERGPGLGLTNAGNLMASWVSDKDRLIIEFLPNKILWVITRFIDDEPEHFTGSTKINRLVKTLAPYNPEKWFSK